MIDCEYRVTLTRPATSILVIACGMENPSYTGTACVTPSPLSNTTPVVRPLEYKLSVACGDTNNAGVPNVSCEFSV